MSEMDLRLKNTELCVLLTGAKNADLKGAKEYCRLHKEADKAVDTVILSIDTVFNAETLAVVSKSGKATDLVAKASENAGVNISSTVLKKDYPILGAEEFKECKTPEDYLKKLNNELKKLNKESTQNKKRSTSLHR